MTMVRPDATRAQKPLPPPICMTRHGWPWELPPSRARVDDSKGALPRVSIVTPSYNQASFLEETIRSVIAQDYPGLEYFVVDGGSTDGSVAVMEYYRPWLTGVVVERDRGQSDAINKGWRMATGDLFGWLNSDDVFLPNAIRIAARGCAEAERPVAVIAGSGMIIDEAGNRVGETVPHHLDGDHLVRFWKGGFAFLQAAMLFRRDERNRNANLVDESLRYVMDYDLLCRALRYGEVLYVSEALAAYRIHATAKSIAETVPMFQELSATSRRYWKSYGLSEADHADHDRYVAETLTQGVLSMVRRGRVREATRVARHLADCSKWDVGKALLGRVCRGVRDANGGRGVDPH